MTRSLTRSILWSLLICWLSGCTALTTLSPIASGEADLFARGLDQYQSTGDLATLKLLPQRYPQGEWATRAEAIIGVAEQLRQQQTQLEKLAEEKERLTQKNQSLQATLERLKQVLIEMERQAN